MGNYVIIDYSGCIEWNIQPYIVNVLKQFKPRRCPFKDYTMFDLLIDWVRMYSWQLDRNHKYSLTEFVKKIHGDGKIIVYSTAMLELLARN